MQQSMTVDQLSQAAECLKVLGHSGRLRIVELLLRQRATVGEIATECELPSSVASGHLRLLQRCGFLAAERDGRHVYYRVTDPCLKKLMQSIRSRFQEPQ